MIACRTCQRPLTIAASFRRNQHIASCENGHIVVLVEAPAIRLDLGLPDVHTSCARPLPFIPFPSAGGARMCRGRRRDRIRRRGVDMLLN